MISWEQEGEYLRIRLDRAQGPMSGGNAGVWLFACLQDAACLARVRIQLVKSTVLPSRQVLRTHYAHCANAEAAGTAVAVSRQTSLAAVKERKARRVKPSMSGRVFRVK